MDDESPLPPAHPEFAQHFTDPIYDEPGDDLGPFGSDEAADSITEALDGPPITAATTLRELVAREFADVGGDAVIDDPDEDDPSFDMSIVGLGFLILRMHGRIDADGGRILLAAVERMQAAFGDFEQLATMRRDLETFLG
ncbi:hypothetical protein [Homoserinibacter sp. YIM 151385]|uniref:hypothetical protein n=1 Tax=Homoserinibacter sp. YIM 151385 TaxID=2985506 RepID=UPI0022F0EE83|nr:hypothetical protein [Homoserinibacter sp. YIM 151385]WBU37009.1 hypothetical protein OF852_08720 [Homoserinibacter sp. YIM 151385]